MRLPVIPTCFDCGHAHNPLVSGDSSVAHCRHPQARRQGAVVGETYAPQIRLAEAPPAWCPFQRDIA